MPFDWNEFQELAEELRQKGSEASQRTAISRVYYAVYWNARLYLENEGFILQQIEGSHTQIWKEYKNRGRTHKAIGYWGSELHKKRLKADYEADLEDISTLVNDSFDIAEKVLRYLKQIQPKDESEK